VGLEPEPEVVVKRNSTVAEALMNTKKNGFISGSVTGKVISEEQLANIPKYESLYRQWLQGGDLKAKRWSVTAHDFAVAMVLLRHFHEKPNADKSLPCRRAAELWTGLYEAGDVQRPWNHHRWKAIRDFLSANGHIDWFDARYEWGQNQVRGIACKWTITERFALTLEMVGNVTTDKRGGPSFVDTAVRPLIPNQGTGLNLRPTPFPIRAERERMFLFRANEACDNLFAA